MLKSIIHNNFIETRGSSLLRLSNANEAQCQPPNGKKEYLGVQAEF